MRDSIKGFAIKPKVNANVILTIFSGSLAGVAKGVTYCGAESPAITDPYTMRIKISTLLFLILPTIVNRL